jgi:hypothetical protein
LQATRRAQTGERDASVLAEETIARLQRRNKQDRNAARASLMADRNRQNDAISFVTHRNRMKFFVLLKVMRSDKRRHLCL